MHDHKTETRIFSGSFVAVFAINLCVMTGYYLLFIITGPFAAERFGAAPNMAGLVSGIMIIGCLAGRFVTGGSIHRLGFRKVLFVGLVLYTGSMALYLLADSMDILLVNRFIGGVGVGCIGTVTGTIVACGLPPQQRGLGISYFSLSTIIALAAGPFLAISLMQVMRFTGIFMLCIGVGALSCVMAFGMRSCHVPQPAPEEGGPAAAFRLSEYIELRTVPLGIVVMLTSLSYCTVQTFLSFYAKELRLMGAASLFFLVYAAVVFASRPLTGKIFDHRGENIIMYPAIMLTAGSLVVLSLADAAWMMLLSAAMLGAGFGNFQSLAQATCLKMVAPHRFGQATSTYYILFDLGLGLGPFLFGYLVPLAGYSGLYQVTAVVTLACLPLYYLFHGRKHRGNWPGL